MLRRIATNFITEMRRGLQMTETKQNVLFGVGSAAAAAAMFAPLSYAWKGILAGIATDAILTGIYGRSRLKRAFGF